MKLKLKRRRPTVSILLRANADRASRLANVTAERDRKLLECDRLNKTIERVISVRARAGRGYGGTMVGCEVRMDIDSVRMNRETLVRHVSEQLVELIWRHKL